MALSLYRKYRPAVFADVVGQEHIERTLANAIAEGSVASAYLFCGPRGTGKTTTARLLAKALLCEQGAGHQPDGTCEQCRAIAQGAHPDVYELDAASRTGVDNVREEIISRVQFAPTRGRYKVYIIDEVHMLSTAAFNALLKTLEEPPEHVVFILCTTDPHKVPETIQSRCQRFDFRRLSIEEIVRYLERICTGEGFSYEKAALEYIAAKAAGGMRDATTSLEQASVYTQGQITLERVRGLFGQLDADGLFEIAGHIAACDTAACFSWIDRLVNAGADLSQFAHGLAGHLRDLYVTALTGGGDGIVKCLPEELPRYREQAAAFGTPERLSHALAVCGALVSELRNSSDARLSVEVALTRLCRPESDLTLEALAARVAALEAGAPSRPARQTAAPQPNPQPVAAQAPQTQGGPDDAGNWAPVEPERPAWKEIAETRNRERAARDGSEQNTGVPLKQAVAREREREELEADRAEEPRPQPQEPRAQMSPARLLAAVLTVVKREDVATGALLNGVTLQEDERGYHLSFPQEAGFAMSIASKGKARDLIARAFREVLGTEAAFDCRIDSLAAAQEAVSARQVPVRQSPVSRPGPAEDGPAFEAQPAVSAGPRPLDDETAANLADALSAFGAGVTVEEIDDNR